MHNKIEMTKNANGQLCTLTQYLDNPETLMSIEDDVIEVYFSNIGEGICGDYNPDDPEDINLIRFDVFIANPDIDPEDKNRWEEVEDASYCTNIPVNTPADELKEKIKLIHAKYREAISSYEDYLSGSSVKKLGEELSWIE